MGWFGRRKASPGRSAADREVWDHLTAFVRSRYGVEGYLEPPTLMTATTLLLIAHDGEWTRRRVGDPVRARRFTQKMNIPLYDVQLVGYPQRFRDYHERRRRRPDAR
ncbi:MAG TPA: hypothetical protein VFY17_02580 [Pilimelia sp.]|nr:hypothetical protein [Pilimelia sp.]